MSCSRAGEALSHHCLCLLAATPYQQELLRRGVQRLREEEMSTEALDLSMGYTGVVGTSLLWEMVASERRAEEREGVIA